MNTTEEKPFKWPVPLDSPITYPLGKNRLVTIDPLRQFGAPCVQFRVPTYTLYGMFCAGDSISTVANCYEITTEQVEAAIQYESMIRCRHGRAAIKKMSVTEPRAD